MRAAQLTVEPDLQAESLRHAAGKPVNRNTLRVTEKEYALHMRPLPSHS
jgi:hypothetical protein